MTAGEGYADVLVGLQYGDEGKAKIIDLLAAEYDIVARFNGGANAGHTVATQWGTAKLRQVPSAVFHPGKLLYIGSGCAVGLTQLAEEIDALKAHGISLAGRLFLSSRCAVVQPAHLHLDRLHGKEIGTTGNGIGPCYADRARRMQGGARVAWRLQDLLAQPETTIAQMQSRLVALAGASDAATAEMDALRDAWQVVEPFVVDDPLFLVKRVKAGAKVLFEGAQSVLLDVLHGDQPFVTSSHTAPSYAYVGGDLPCSFHRKSIGVVKAIMSRVGSGAFPSELGGIESAAYCEEAARTGKGEAQERERFDPALLLASGDDFQLGIALRMLTGEYGTGSGRPRRVGLLDVQQLAEAVALHGIDEIFLNKCDCLVHFAGTPQGVIPLTTGSGVVKFPPFSLPATELPAGLSRILGFIEEEAGCKVRGIGIGPAREQAIFLNNML